MQSCFRICFEMRLSGEFHQSPIKWQNRFCCFVFLFFHISSHCWACQTCNQIIFVRPTNLNETSASYWKPFFLHILCCGWFSWALTTSVNLRESLHIFLVCCTGPRRIQAFRPSVSTHYVWSSYSRIDLSIKQYFYQLWTHLKSWLVISVVRLSSRCATVPLIKEMKQCPSAEALLS